MRGRLPFSIMMALSFVLLAPHFQCVAQSQLRSEPIIRDIDDHPDQVAAIERMVSQGVMRVTSPGSFSPDKFVTRRQFAACIQRLFGLPATLGKQRFDDVPPTDPDYAAINSIAPYMKRQAFCPGCQLNRKLNPDQAVSQIEQAVILTSLLIERHQLTLVGPEQALNILPDAPVALHIAVPARRFLATAVQSNIVSRESIAIETASRASTASLLDNVQQHFRIRVIR